MFCAPDLQVALPEVRTRAAVNGHEDGLVAPAHVDAVLLLVVHVLVQLAAPHLAPETEEEGELALSDLESEEVRDILNYRVRRWALVEEQSRFFLCSECKRNTRIFARLESLEKDK